MDMRGLVLIGFSGLCLAAAGLAYEEDRKRGISSTLAQATQPMRQCERDGIVTSQGRVGCFTPVSARLFGGYSGGSAMTRR